MEKTKISLKLLLVIAGLMLVLSISPVMADDSLASSESPKYQGDNQNTGQSTYTGPQTNQTQWNYTLNSSETISITPAVGPDGTIYLPVHMRYKDDLRAINPDGSLKWNYTIPYRSFNRISGTPAVSQDGTIYVPGYYISDDPQYFGFILALNPNGTFKWIYTNGGIDGCTSPAIGSDGTIYTAGYYQGLKGSVTGMYGVFYAINPNGTLKWRYDIPDQGNSYSYGAPAIGPDGTIYFTAEVAYYTITSRLYAFDPNGTLKWQKIINPNPSYYTNLRISPVVANDGTIFITPQYYNYVDHTTVGYAFNPDGSEKWTSNYLHTLIRGLALASDGTLYLTGWYEKENSRTGILYAIGQDGTQKWNYTTDYPLNFNPVIGNDGTIYFGEDTVPDTLYALNRDGTLKWSLPVQTTTAPVIGASGALYVGIVTDGLLGQVYSLLAIRSPYSPQDDPTSNNSNDPANTVNAASKTIKMQETGLPINLMVLAVLMVLGGLIQTKRN
ncbi:PQQ-binding-like beta-propeller repeat protein [Methanobacterium sp. BAmetb5]|uniref:PQQ-binding-like beta-propeller repeat protein n=1 Tax=Methanobacterium sp. BAmetb5 TaxID=2025351 RepID=UPI000E8F4A89|nr:PQQ-binding-like beta-propeller repeat protein [Methanobacterium sp. BAmetb5]AXV39106.1 MAG: hypothetical protein CIT02_01635 [Methanobacterium sp. BAmetb5]